MKLRMLAVLILVASMFASGHSSAAGFQQSNRVASPKIATWVLEHTADGNEAEFLVVLADQADLSAAEKLTTKEEKGLFVYKTLYEKAQATQRPILDWLEVNGVEHRSYYIVNMIWVKGKIDVANSLAARSDVARIDGNPVIHNNLPQPGSQEKVKPAAIEAIEPGINYTNAPQVWALGYTGQGIVVGGADTGYQWDHPALKPHYRGWNGTTANHDFNWHDSIHATGSSCGANSPQPCDDHGHGSHTMGTAIGDDGGTNQIGMAPGAKWIGCRNMNQGNGTPTTYAECFQFFLAPYPVGGTPAQGDPTKAPDVTTHSWGCPPSEGCTSSTWVTIQSAIQANRAAGIVTVVAAGNSGGSGCSTVSDAPSFFPEVVTVGALVTSTDSIASFSSRGPVTIDGSNRQKPDIAAPGTNTRSSVPVNGYSSNFSGTSMATPHVAGAVALLLSADPSRRGQVSTIESIMKDSAVHISSALCSSNGVPNNVFGFGRLDVKGAVDLAQTTIAPVSAVGERRNARGSVNVNAPTITTQWTAFANQNWIVLTSPGAATGSGVVTYELRENSTGHFRIGTLTIAQRTFTIIQSGVAPGACTNSIGPASSLFNMNGGPGVVTITAGSECIWTASSNASWITITSSSSGIGNGTVNYSVANNSTGAARKGTITVAGRTFNVKQTASGGGD